MYTQALRTYTIYEDTRIDALTHTHTHIHTRTVTHTHTTTV